MNLTIQLINPNYLPNFDKSAYIWQSDEFPDLPGIYLIHDKKDKLLYCGETESLKTRMRDHFKGNPTTSSIHEFKDYLYFVKFFSLLPVPSSNKFDRLILETYFINTLQPLFNKDKAAYTTKDQVDKAKLQYAIDNPECALKSELEQEAIDDLGEPEERLLQEFFEAWKTAAKNGFSEEQEELYENKGGHVGSLQLWKECKDRETLMNEIIHHYNMDEETIMKHAREYSRFDEDSDEDNIFTHGNWSHAKFSNVSILF